MVISLYNIIDGAWDNDIASSNHWRITKPNRARVVCAGVFLFSFCKIF